MVPVETQETTDSLPTAQTKSDITRLDVPRTVASTNGQKKDVCDTVMPPELPLNVFYQEIPEEFAFPFPDPASTLQIQGSARSDQGAQGTCSPPSSSVLCQNITTTADSGPQAEQLASRAAFSEVVHEGGVQPPNISYGGSTVNSHTSLPSSPMGQNPLTRSPLFSDPFEYEMEKIRREQENLRKNFEETTSELMAELEKKMAEVRSEYDRKAQEVDAEYNAKAMEQEAIRSSVEMSSLLANAFLFKCTDTSAATDLPAVRAISSQHSIQQQQAVVQTNTHMNSTAPPRPSVTAAEAPIPNLSGPLLHLPRCTTTQPRLISQEAVVQTNTHMNSTAPPLPSVTAVEAPIPDPSGPLLHFARSTTTQPRPISQQAAVQSNTHMDSAALPRPSATVAETLSLHSPRCNTAQPRPPPLISNLTPSSSPPVYGIVRAPAPHLQPFRASRAPNAAAAASTTYPRRLVQEEQQGNSNSDLVCLSDDDE